MCRCEQIYPTIASRHTRSADPMQRLARSGCALLFVERWYLYLVSSHVVIGKAFRCFHVPFVALYILATLSMLPVMKNIPSGDHAKSYISEPLLDLHIVLTLHVSTSSCASSPNVELCAGFSEGTQRRTLPSSPAVASISPVVGQHTSSRAGLVAAYLADTTVRH